MVTIKDIARVANVSTASVSRVVHNVSGVSEPKRQAILKAMAELGYKLNDKQDETNSLMLGVFGVLVPNCYDSIYSDVLAYLEEYASSHHNSLMIKSHHSSISHAQNCLKQFARLGVEAVFYIPSCAEVVNLERTKLLGQNSKLKIIVLLEHSHFDPSVIINYQKMMGLAYYHLLQEGCSALGFVGTQGVHYEQYSAFLSFLHDHDLKADNSHTCWLKDPITVTNLIKNKQELLNNEDSDISLRSDVDTKLIQESARIENDVLTKQQSALGNSLGSTLESSLAITDRVQAIATASILTTENSVLEVQDSINNQSEQDTTQVSNIRQSPVSINSANFTFKTQQAINHSFNVTKPKTNSIKKVKANSLPSQQVSFADRLQALNYNVEEASHTLANALHLLRKTNPQGRLGIFVCEGDFAVLLQQKLKSIGLGIPEDIAIVTMGIGSNLLYQASGLTTVAVDMAQLVEKAFQELEHIRFKRKESENKINSASSAGAGAVYEDIASQAEATCVLVDPQIFVAESSKFNI